MSALFFSTFDVTRQAFYRARLAAAIVNLKPIVPGRAYHPSAYFLAAAPRALPHPPTPTS